MVTKAMKISIILRRGEARAQQRIVEMMLPDEGLAEIRLQRKDPPEVLGSDAGNEDR